MNFSAPTQPFQPTQPNPIPQRPPFPATSAPMNFPGPPQFGIPVNAPSQDLLQEQQRALLQQVLSLTPEQIDKLPLDQRQQVLQLRQTVIQTYRGFN